MKMRVPAQYIAEIVAGPLLCGEISLAAAITAGDFIHAHEKYGRNRLGCEDD